MEDQDRIFKCGEGKVRRRASATLRLCFGTIPCVQGEGPRPVVVVLGWAGAKHQHLDKYSQIYRWGGETSVGRMFIST